jgi:hypothetical protein
MAFSRSSVWLLPTLALVSLSCSVATDEEPAAERSENAVRTTCGCSHFAARVVSSSRCRDVVGSAGRWKASTLVRAAQEPTFCRFDWAANAASPKACPDQNAITDYALDAEMFVPDCPVCQPGTRGCNPTVELLEGDPRPPGSTCEVCGSIRDGKLYALLPSDIDSFVTGQPADPTDDMARYFFEGEHADGTSGIGLVTVPAGTGWIDAEVGGGFEDGSVSIQYAAATSIMPH